MGVIADTASGLPSSFRGYRLHSARISADPAAACLSALLGLGVTVLLCTLGYGAAVGEILATAG